LGIEAHTVCSLVTAPMTEVIGIYGLSTDAMQPHSNCLMVSRSHVPSFTRWPSHRNLLLRVQVQSLIDLPESILLLVAKIRQKCIALLGYIGIPWSESNRHGLYPAFEKTGISPAFVLNELHFQHIFQILQEQVDVLMGHVSHQNQPQSSFWLTGHGDVPVAFH